MVLENRVCGHTERGRQVWRCGWVGYVGHILHRGRGGDRVVVSTWSISQYYIATLVQIYV